MKYRYLYTLSLALLFFTAETTSAQSVTESRTLEKTFGVKEEMSLDIKNKYGKVHLSPSKNDSIYIRIELNARASKTSKLRRLIDGISFNLTSTNHFVIAETRFNKGPIDFLEGVRSFTNNLITSGSRLTIDYYVAVPEYIDVNLDNRYGDIYIESTKSNLDIKASNGVIKGENLWGNNIFDLNFCNTTIESVKESKLTISYGELELKKANNVRLFSTSSKVEIDDVESLIVESKRDKYYIKYISSLEGSGYFTDFRMELLRDKLNMNTRYGKIIIEQVPRNLGIISVESSYTDLYLNMDPDTSFELDAKLTNCDASIPEGWVFNENTLSSERQEYLYTGIVGNQDTKSKVILKLTRGRIDFNQN